MPTVRRIIVGVHGSLGSLQALRFAADEARQRSVPLLAVTAWVPPGRRRGHVDTHGFGHADGLVDTDDSACGVRDRAGQRRLRRPGRRGR